MLPPGPSRRASAALRGRRTRDYTGSECDLAGFTLVEVMVLLVVMGVVALVIIPQVLGATRRSNEAALRGDLHTFRVAIERFYADCGAYPPRLQDIFAWTADDISARFDGAGRELDLRSYHGPYLRTGDMLPPLDPFTDRRDWRYDSASGQIHSNSDLIARDGTPYSSW